MRIQKRNYLELFLQVVITVLYYIPGLLNSTGMNWTGIGWEADRRADRVHSMEELTRSHFAYATGDYTTLGKLTIALAFVVLVLCAVQILMKGKWRNTLIVPSATILQAAMFLFYVHLTASSVWDSNRIELGYQVRLEFLPLYYVLVALIVGLAFICVAGYFLVKKKGALEETSLFKVKSNSSPSELQEYKELLDKGVITQEEFEAKKKQLLNL